MLLHTGEDERAETISIKLLSAKVHLEKGGFTISMTDKHTDKSQ